MNASEQKREQCEQKFKQIQEANSLIGMAEDRTKYDSKAQLQQRYGDQSRSYGTGAGSHAHAQQAMAQETFRQFFQQAGDPFGRKGYGPGHTYRRPRRAFYVNGIDVSNLFDPSRNSMNAFANGSKEAATDFENAPRSIFVETITVPLEDLYNGSRRKEFKLHNSIFQRYKAAFAGGIASKIALQCFFTSLPLLLRVSWPVSFISFVVTFHLSLPRPSRLIYFSRIKAGWKGGTKLKFAEVEPGLDVVFVLNEGKHDRFKREGNDLQTSIQIGRSKAKKGCTLFIEPLGVNEMPITVKLKRGDITEKCQVVTVKGKGWPRAEGGKGDLKIIVNVVSDTKASRLKRKKAKR